MKYYILISFLKKRFWQEFFSELRSLILFFFTLYYNKTCGFRTFKTILWPMKRLTTKVSTWWVHDITSVQFYYSLISYDVSGTMTSVQGQKKNSSTTPTHRFNSRLFLICRNAISIALNFLHTIKNGYIKLI